MKLKSGSALLIVLGMMAFMLISAVAFSAYMRYSRLPSSFLRRSSASRLLVKAALAEAIDEIDAAIGNNPHPGVGTLQPRLGAGSLSADLGGIDNEDTRTRNHWKHRIYIGTNSLHAVEDTVSTLSLEGLAYIPPALVNEARYYSRRSQAAIWKNLGFDSGRYAFCAIDVSDHFDVNALAAKVGRSSAPASRISLAYLFENEDHTASNDPKAWDDFVEKGAMARTMSSAEAEIRGLPKPPADATHVPFVSVADLNLAIHDKKPVGWESPFCRFIETGGDSFYNPVGVSDVRGAAADRVRRMNFVTEGLFPPTSYENAADADYDLADEQYQPFERDDLKAGGRAIVWPVRDCATKTAQLLRDTISGIGLAMLWDYLDDDDVPVSLAMPSTEAVPMITGIREDFSQINLTVTSRTEPDGIEQKLTGMDCPNAVVGGDGKTRTVTYEKIYTLDGKAFADGVRNGSLRVTVACPFPRRELDIYKLDGHISFFFTVEQMGLRAGNADLLHVKSDAGGDLPRMITGLQPAEQNVNGVFHVPLGQIDCTFSDVKDEASAVQDIENFNVSFAGAAPRIVEALDQSPLVTVTWTVHQVAILNDESKVIGWKEDPGQPPQRTAATGKLPVLRGDGTVDPAFAAGGNLLPGLQSKPTLNLNAAICLRVKNAADKTVDLVPAYLDDDRLHNNVNNMGAMGGQSTYLGTAVPLMLFRGAGLLFSDEEFDKNVPVAGGIAAKSVICLDPRWNWAPEHWIDCGGQEASKTTWLQKCHDLFNRTGSFGGDTIVRDRDIFMASSDAGYMQSVFELAFLPRVTGLAVGDAGSVWGWVDSPSSTVRTDFATEQDFLQGGANGVPNADLMWVTYRPYQVNRNNTIAARDPFDNLGIVSEGGGFKVNPYSDITNVVMAAFANSPLNWWAASVDPDRQTGVEENDRLDAVKFNKTYAFNEVTGTKGENRIVWTDLERVACNFIRRVRNRPNDSWQDSFDGLDWSGSLTHPQNDDYKDYFGIAQEGTAGGYDMNQLSSETCDLFDVDRKYLYGYWRESFAAKQQLFLVFVRAEPMMMGGGARGQMPPQLGGRAVALVWRDPTASRDSTAPHKTRILFYRQFE